MSTDLTVVQPASGEILDLSRDTEDLARWIDELRELERRSKEVRGLIGDELVRRMDQSAKWTIHANGFKLTAPSPAPKYEYDVDLLRPVLADLQAEGLIAEEAADAALEIDVKYKPKVAGLNALCKLGGVVQERILACRSEVEQTRNVTVKTER